MHIALNANAKAVFIAIGLPVMGIGQIFILLLNKPRCRFRLLDIFTFVASFVGELEKRRYNKGFELKRLGKTLLSFCFFIALAFFFLWKLPPTGSHANQVHRGFQFTGLHTSLSGGIGNFYRIPINHPKASGPVLTSITEPEPEDDIQVVGFSFVCQAGCFISALQRLLQEHTLSALPPPFLQNRPTVPLFVLFHSWKNFIR